MTTLRKAHPLKRPRDSRGWRVPLAGSKSHVIYELMLRGLRRGEIVRETGFDTTSVGVLMFKIRNPGTANALNVRKTAKAIQ